MVQQIVGSILRLSCHGLLVEFVDTVCDQGRFSFTNLILLIGRRPRELKLTIRFKYLLKAFPKSDWGLLREDVSEQCPREMTISLKT